MRVAGCFCSGFYSEDTLALLQQNLGGLVESKVSSLQHTRAFLCEQLDTSIDASFARINKDLGDGTASWFNFYKLTLIAIPVNFTFLAITHHKSELNALVGLNTQKLVAEVKDAVGWNYKIPRPSSGRLTCIQFPRHQL